MVVRDELNRVLGETTLDDLTNEHYLDGEPLRGMLIYNTDMVHGDMHVWLTPCASNTLISYVIHVREERLK